MSLSHFFFFLHFPKRKKIDAKGVKKGLDQALGVRTCWLSRSFKVILRNNCILVNVLTFRLTTLSFHKFSFFSFFVKFCWYHYVMGLHYALQLMWRSKDIVKRWLIILLNGLTVFESWGLICGWKDGARWISFEVCLCLFISLLCTYISFFLFKELCLKELFWYILFSWMQFSIFDKSSLL